MKVPSSQFSVYKLAQQSHELGDMAMDYKTSRILASSNAKSRAYVERYVREGWLAMNGDLVSISPACRRYFDMLVEVQKPVGDIVQPRTVDVYSSKPWKCNLRRDDLRDIYFMAGSR